MGWDGVSDFYEEDEPLEVILRVSERPPDVITTPPPGWTPPDKGAPVSVEPERPPHMMPEEQALAGMLGAFLLTMRFSLDRMDPADQEEFWECVLDRAGIATGGPRGPIERHLFEVM